MVESTLADQSYGHFGTPVYDVQNKRWIFGRSSMNSWHYRPLGGVKRIISGTKTIEEKDTSTLRQEEESQNEEAGKALTKGIRSIVTGNPELQAAEELLGPLAHVSEAVHTAVIKYDPAVGDVLAFGTAAISDGQNRRYKTRILAIPGGTCGEMLRLVRLQTETYGWNEHEARLKVPSPSEEIGWWIGKGAPIQQICTPDPSELEDAGTFLAVRLPGTILILRPQYRASPVPPAGIHPGCTIPPSRVDANLLLEISPRDWQGQQHADVTFDPWNQRRLAIVNQAGEWIIFKLRQDYKGSQTHVKTPGISGSLEGIFQESKTRERVFTTQQDGWARILWVADKNTLVVCTRRRFQLFSLSAETALPFTKFLSQNEWILDVKRCPEVLTWLFVLTSTRVLWLEILPEIDRGTDITATTGKVLLSAHHFRDSSDISLQMDIEKELDVISLLVWSRNCPLVTCMRLDRQQSITGLPSMLGPPTELLLPVPGKGTLLPTAGIVVRRLAYDEMNADSRSPGVVHSLQLLTEDLALHHAFMGRSNDLLKAPPTRIASARTNPKIAPFAVDEDDDFIVPDELSQKRPTSRRKRRFAHKVGYGSSSQNFGKNKQTDMSATVHNEVIHSKLCDDPKHESRQDINDITNDLQGLILDEDVRGLGESVKTLLELALSPIPEVGELAETSRALSDLLSLSRPGPVPDEAGVAVTRLQIPAWVSPMDVGPEELDFSGLYNHIIEHQLAPLADEISPRLRMRREKLARQIAAEVILSSSHIEIVDTPGDSQEHQEPQQTLPILDKGKASITDSFPASSQLSEYMSSQTLPTPSPSASRAASTIMSGTTTSLPSTSSQTITSRLSRHVKFAPPSSSWATRPMALLAHWDLGADPSTYSYIVKLDELEKQKKEESMTEKQRRKALGKAERRLKRQRREAEKARGALMSSQPIVMSSQAHRGGSQYGGSQYGAGSQHGRSSPPLPSSPPPMLDRPRDRGFAMSSQMAAPPMVGSSQAPSRRGDGPAKRKKMKRQGF